MTKIALNVLLREETYQELQRDYDRLKMRFPVSFSVYLENIIRDGLKSKGDD